MNATKQIIQKEEYIALAVNKYILQTGEIPKTDNKKLNWELLVTSDIQGEYLSTGFNKTNPITGNDIEAEFDDNNNLFIYGILEKDEQYNTSNNYTYNFYINRMFRVNTQSPKNNTKDELLKGSQVLYQNLANEVTKLLAEGKNIRVSGTDCPTSDYFYELNNNKLTFKYCKTSNSSFDIYQEEPIYVEDLNDLSFIKAEIGSKAYAQKNGNWFEYYYQGDVSESWVPVESGSILNSQDEEEDIEDRIISYIPDSKDISLRSSGGCMLANGDIFCWGNNHNKKSGIETQGQLNPNLSANYINTPVMLKVQIDNTVKITDDSGTEYTRRDKRWYNNPYRVKFEKMAFNSTNVCGISPIFDYFQSGEYKKFGGDVFCNGKLSSEYFEDITDSTTAIEVSTSILKRNKYFAQFKDDQKDDDSQKEVYLKNVVMIDDTIAVISQAGEIYTSGSNEKGALGINNTDESYIARVPTLINKPNQIFKEVFALRDIKCFGAIDEYNNFYIWGERPSGDILYEPTSIGSREYDPNAIFVNSKEFVLRATNKSYYRTYNTTSTKKLPDTLNNALSVSIFDLGSSEMYIYIDEDRKIKGTSDLISCLNSTGSSCSSSDKTVFNLGFDKLNGAISEDGTFSNVSIFRIEGAPLNVSQNFEGTVSGWSNNKISYGNSITGNYLGNFGNNQNLNINKTFNFGIDNAYKDVNIQVDFYEIDSWDNNKDRLSIKVNNSEKATYKFDWNPSYDDDQGFNESFIAPIGTSGNGYFNNDEKHTFIYNDKLNNSGDLKLEFIGKTDQNLADESWGIDNLNISIAGASASDAIFICAMTGLGSSSQMYCWGHAGRSLPILSTSLYDVNNISTMNKLFVTQNSDISKRMAFSEFDNDGKLFLKYPTYIGGFDYEFYFK